MVMGGGDGLCSNVGAGSISPGRTFSCIGFTSAWVATTSEKPLFDEEMRTFTWAHIVPGCTRPPAPCRPAAVPQLAQGARWPNMRPPWPKCGASALRSHQRGGGKRAPRRRQRRPFPALSAGGAGPRWNPDATAAWLGLKMENQRCDLFRPYWEGGHPQPEHYPGVLPEHPHRRAAGGGRRRKGPSGCQMMADVPNARIKVPVLLEEATSMGAAVHRRRGRGGVQGL